MRYALSTCSCDQSLHGGRDLPDHAPNTLGGPCRWSPSAACYLPIPLSLELVTPVLLIPIELEPEKLEPLDLLPLLLDPDDEPVVRIVSPELPPELEIPGPLDESVGASLCVHTPSARYVFVPGT